MSEVRPLAPTDLPAARALLAAQDLPTDDLGDPAIALYGTFADGTLTGVIGLQTCGALGLLRSLAVEPAFHTRGLGGTLCAHVLAEATARNLGSLWLLTTTAGDYFARHGFEVVARDAVPPEIRATSQFASLCPASALVMRRR